MKNLILSAIVFYQRFISPHKGFKCAAGVYYDSGSCSDEVKKIIEENGVIRGRALIKDQFGRCRNAARALRAEQKKKKPRKNRMPRDASCWLTEAACWSCTFWP